MPMPEGTFRKHSDTYLMTLAPLYGRLRAAAEPQSCYRLHGGNDYACRPVDEKNRRNLEIYEERCLVLAHHLARHGVAADPARWKLTPGYTWMHKFHLAAEAIKAVVPPGESFILVDDQQWSDPGGRGDVISGRRAIPFLERDGRYWGPPPDDAVAINELYAK